MFMMPTLIKMAENFTHTFSPSGQSAAKTDASYYSVEKLRMEHRLEWKQAMVALAEQSAPEGSILLIKPGKEQPGFDVLTVEGSVMGPDYDTGQTYTEHQESKKNLLSGLERGAKVAQRLLDHPMAGEIEALVIPGCGSSPVGTAAFGKQVAETLNKPVAAFNVGQGDIDKYAEIFSGGVPMNLMANTLNAFDQILEFTAKLHNVAAKMYLHEMMDSIHEAATLYALLKARLVEGKLPKLNMIVSHSKGNWALLVALLNIELDLADEITLKQPMIDVVTFGNPVNLPNMVPEMKKVFRYHQYVGDNDPLAHKCSARAWVLHFSGKPVIDPQNPVFDPMEEPDERLFANTVHHVFAKDEPETKPYHMPIEKILPMVREAAIREAADRGAVPLIRAV